MYTEQELRVLNDCGKEQTKIQTYLDSIPFDGRVYDTGEYEARSFRKTVKDGQGLCLCAALTAAHILEYNGQEPLLLDIWSRPLEHTVAIYQNGKVGSLGKSRQDGAGGQPSTFDSVEEVAQYYANFFRGIGWEVEAFGVIDLSKIDDIDWRFELRNLDELGICQRINKFPHYKI
ncbi:MAG: hypothetical protein Q8Q42_01000 [Nanoarchaeota archaeon]|nr:hypothetical protein [Nanoarchaeota archaeon]